MRFPESWLREWVATDLDTEALAERLTLLGLEVDSVEPVAPPFSGVVVGRIDAVDSHPSADRLRVCQVDDGSGNLHTVVCGAPNAEVGLRAPFARVGAILPDGTKIRAAKLRGVESAGMLCSATELGLEATVEGLWALAGDAPVGADVRALAGLDETIIEIDLTPNRGDCLCLRGIARELAAATDAAVTPAVSARVAAALDERLPITLSAPASCPRYAGRIIRGLKADAVSPAWLQQRLEHAGIRPIQPLVDVTNLVMLELGQPMHAFDLARLRDGIDVRPAQAGESLLLLDERSVQLDEDTLVIADGNGPVALAGIMGGAATAVSNDTVDVFLESACFLPVAMAGRARRYASHTDSSHRFERGVDPELAPVALERATALIQSICGGDAGPIEDRVEHDHLPGRAIITLRSERLEKLLGYAPETAATTAMLERLGLSIEVVEDGWRAQIPSWRFDLGIEADLVEEVARLYGYNHAPRTHPDQTARIAPRDETRRSADALRYGLVERGYHEVVTYSFVDAELQTALDPDTTPLILANPIASDMAAMRTSTWPGLLQTAVYNVNRQQERVRLFEIGECFRPAAADHALEQRDVVGGLAVGASWPEQWAETARATDFFDAKGDLEALLPAHALDRFGFVATHHPALHPGQSARIECDGTPIGWIGTLHPRLQQRFDLGQAPILFEFELATMLDEPLPAFENVSRYPAIRRDIAVIVDETVSAHMLLESVWTAAPAELREAIVFDVYRGRGIDSGRKSIALGLILQGSSRTLTDAEVDRARHDVLAHLQNIHGATLRE